MIELGRQFNNSLRAALSDIVYNAGSGAFDIACRSATARFPEKAANASAPSCVLASNQRAIFMCSFCRGPVRRLAGQILSVSKG